MTMKSDICAPDGTTWPKEEKEWYQHIFGEENVGVVVVDGMDGGELIVKTVERTSNWDVLAVIDTKRTRLRFIWKAKAGIGDHEKEDAKQEKKEKVLGEMKFEDTKLRHDWVVIRNVPLDGYVRDCNSFILDVITCDRWTDANMLGRIVWRANGEKICEEIREHGPTTMFGRLVTYGTGVLMNPHYEFVLVGGRGRSGSVPVHNNAIKGAEKKRTWHVIQRVDGKWVIKQQELLPKQIGAETARFCDHERYENASGVCVGTNNEDEHAWISYFFRNDQNDYECSYWYDLYHKRYCESMGGRKVHSVVHGVTSERIWAAFTQLDAEDLEICQLLHVDLCDSGKTHEIKLYTHGLDKITSFDCIVRNEYNIRFLFARGNNYSFKDKEICCWDQQRLVFIAVKKEKPADCHLAKLPMDVAKTMLKFAGDDETYPVFGGPLPLTLNDKKENGGDEANVKASNNTANKPVQYDQQQE